MERVAGCFEAERVEAWSDPEQRRSGWAESGTTAGYSSTSSPLEIPREPIEDEPVTIVRSAMTVCFPAPFMLVAAMNSCPFA